MARPASVELRFDALHASGPTELVEKVEFLLRHWSKAKTGEGQVVPLSGESGIGKARLIATLLERIAPNCTRDWIISAPAAHPQCTLSHHRVGRAASVQQRPPRTASRPHVKSTNAPESSGWQSFATG